MRRRRRRRRITIPMFLCCFDTHFDTDDWHCLQLCVKRPFNSSPVVLRPSLGKPKRWGNSPGFSGSCGIYLWKICVSNEALLRLSIIVDEGRHKEMPKDGDSQLWGWRLICLRTKSSEKLEVLTPLLEIHGNSTQHVMLLLDSYLTSSQEYMMPPSVAPQLPLASKHEPGVVDETYFDTAEFEALECLGWKRILDVFWAAKSHVNSPLIQWQIPQITNV